MAIGYAVGRRMYDTRSSRIIPNVLPMILMAEPDLRDAAYLAIWSMLAVETTKQEKFTWDVDDWAATSDTLSASAAVGDGVLDVSNPKRWLEKDEWMNKRSGEHVIVKSVDYANSQASVTRAITAQNSSGGTAEAAMNNADTMIRITSVVGEDNHRLNTRTTTPEEFSAYTQAVRKDLSMSRRQIKREFVNDNEWTYQEKKQMEEFRKELNAALLVNEKARYTDPDMGDVTHMTGIRSAITTYASTVGGILYEYDWNAFLAKKALRKGSSNKVGLCSNEAILAISEMTLDRVIYDIPLGTKKSSVGLSVMEVGGPKGGSITLVEDRFLSENFTGEMIIIDQRQMKRMVFSNNGINDDLHLIPETQDKDDMGRVATLYADVGQKFGVESHHSRLTGITGGAKARSAA